MISFDSPIEAVLGDAKSGKGGKLRDAMVERLHLETVGDLLHHFPRRYLETGKLSTVGDLHPGQMLTVIGEVVSAEIKPFQDRRTGRASNRVEVVVATAGPRLVLTYFAPKQWTAEWRLRKMAVGRQGVFVGQAKLFNGTWQLTHPRTLLFGDDGEPEAGGEADLATLDALAALYPVYPLTKGVETWHLQRAVTFARGIVDDVPEVLPESVRREHGLLDARTALEHVHTPESFEQVHHAQRHFRFTEALVTQLVLVRRRRAQRQVGTLARDGGDGALLAAFDSRLPFELTAGQQGIGAEIAADLAQTHPMNRLLQGEVGSGKTLVALRAMLRVVDSGGQAVLLAPTEVLAQQHHRSITAMLGDLAEGAVLGGPAEATHVELLTGSMTKAQRTAPLSRVATGEAGIVVGTHALLEDTVMFDDLGLVVVDEQHRFGVEQRAALTDKARTPPHVLVMTATPIPRTVAMTVFGDLETSTLTELPAGRAPIQSTVVNLVDHPQWMARVWQRVREEVDKGHQAYVVCTRISGDEREQGEHDQPDLDEHGDDVAIDRTRQPPPAAVDDLLPDLAAGPLAGLRLAALHGRMPAPEKDATMRAFAAGEVDVLVATTVIEVGVDVHNATAMVLLDADRFGVSQLHQLRGRVGRGGLPGLCLLVSHAPPETPARERLAAVEATTDGFELSRVDLEQRREGDVLGGSQSGRRSQLRDLRVLRDEDTIREAREAAEALLDADPELATAPVLAAEVAALEERTAADFIDRS